MSLRSDYIEKVKSQLQLLDGRIREKTAKMRMAKADAKLASQKKKLEHKRRKVREQLDQLDRAGEDTWEELKAGMDAALADLKSIVD